ncbi:hypothetical protein WN943_016720 [Citrus x changshan-huyou]
MYSLSVGKMELTDSVMSSTMIWYCFLQLVFKEKFESTHAFIFWFMQPFVDTQLFTVLSDSRLSNFENGYF